MIFLMEKIEINKKKKGLLLQGELEKISVLND